MVFAATWMATMGGAFAQDMLMEAPPGMDNGIAPMTQYGEGGYFSQDLGTILRLRYSTESYGQLGRGNFDIGTMPVWTFDDSAAFVDGQVTLNELQGVGYNIGVGLRRLTNPGYSRGAGRVVGISFWTDGTSTDEGNFFPQIGLSLESLGDMWDFRANGYLPLGPESQQGDFTPTGVVGFEGNSISQLTQAVLNTSYSVAEAEAARRLGAERDAWAFAGPYFVGNDDEDSVGYRVGVRGYAYPDVLLQLAVTDDEIFKTNAAFSITWFVGRTRTDFQPACGVPDRLREPVLRNDYVALSRSFITSGIPLLNPDGDPIRVVHVNGNTDVLGDGTFEQPLADSQFDEVDLFSQEGDIILAWAGSDFQNVANSIVLQDDQRLLGEGGGIDHTVATLEDGTILIPETSPGARDNPDIPTLLNPAADDEGAIILANINEVNNFVINGDGTGAGGDTDSAIISQAIGSGNPVLRNLTISNLEVDGIRLTPLTEVDSEDSDNDGNVTETFVRGNVTIANVTFDEIDEDDIDIDAFTATDVTLPNVTLQEVISITNVESDGNGGRSIAIANTHAGAGRTVTLSDFDYNGGGDSLGGIVLTNFDSTFNATNSTLTGGDVLGAGAQILGDSDGTMTFANTVVFNDLGGIGFDINGDASGTDSLGGTITVNGTITTAGTGRSVRVQNVTNPANIDFNGNITDNAGGILIGDDVVAANGNSGGTITFATGTIDLDIASGNAVTVANNTGATIEFTGPVDIDATGAANGLVAFGGGTLRYSNTANSIDAVNGQAVRIQNMTIQAANGVVISDIRRTGAVAAAAVQLEDNTGGPITLGNVADATPGDSGTLQGGAGADTVVINDSANVTMSNIIINNGADGTGVHIEKTTAGTQVVNLNDLEINGGDRGIDVVGDGNAGDTLNLTVNDNQILDSTELGVIFDNVDSGTIAFVNTDIDGDSDNNGGTAGARGVLINGSNASFNFDVNSSVADFNGTTFQVNEAGAANASSGSITFAGDIINNAAHDTGGRSVLVQQVSGGTVNFTSVSSIEDANLGILVEDNTGGTISFLGDNNLNTGANTAVRLDDNTGATINFANLDIDTTTGIGFHATDGGTLAVTGTTNTIDTTGTGIGLQLENLTIGATGVSFQSVNVNGAANGVILRNLTGGTVAIGNAGGADGDGGTLNTTGTAVVVENTQNVILRNMEITGATTAIDLNHSAAATTSMNVTIDGVDVAAAVSALGMDVDAGSSQAFSLTVDNSTFNEELDIDATGDGTFTLVFEDSTITTGADVIALALNFSGSFTDDDADVTIQRNTITTNDNSAFRFLSEGASAKTVNMLVDNNNFTNNTPVATNQTVSIQSHDGTLLNATIFDNEITNLDATTGEEFFIEAADGGDVVLNLAGNSANSGGGSDNGNFTLREEQAVGSVFSVFEKNATIVTETRNSGNIVLDPNDPNQFDEALSPPPTP
jgi:hypothetical protein